MKWYMQVIKSITVWGLNKLYNYIDKNKDGKLDKKEISDFVKFLENMVKNIKKK